VILNLGDITLTGNADNLDSTISGSGNLNLFELDANTATVNIYGSGNAEINADVITTNIEGSGKISYKGNPDVTEL